MDKKDYYLLLDTDIGDDIDDAFALAGAFVLVVDIFLDRDRLLAAEIVGQVIRIAERLVVPGLDVEDVARLLYILDTGLPEEVQQVDVFDRDAGRGDACGGELGGSARL